MVGEQDIGEGGDQVRFDRSKRTAESTAEDSVIGGDQKLNHQQRHQEMKHSGRSFQGMNKLGEKDGIKPADYESVTIVALTEDGEIKASGKTGLNEKDLEQAAIPTSFRHGNTVNPAETAQEILKIAQNTPSGIGDSSRLLTSNIAPHVPNLNQVRHFEDTLTDAGNHTAVNRDSDNADVLASNHGDPIEGLVSPILFLPDYLIGDSVARFGDIQKAIDSLPEHPFRDHEIEAFRETLKVDAQSWSKAKAQFPELKTVSPDVLKAIPLNELHFYDKFDLAEDVLASSTADSNVKKAIDDKTLGMSQITPQGLRDMCEYFPQLQEFITAKGYSGNEPKALLDSSCIPMIVAAKTALIVRDLNKNHIPVSTDTIAYSYNADVYSYSNGHGGKEYKCLQNALQVNTSKLLHWDQRKEYYANAPEVAKESIHLRNVKRWLKTSIDAN